MGCENSKTVRVLPVSQSKDRNDNRIVTGKEGATQTPEPVQKSLTKISARSYPFSEYSLDEQGNKVRRSAASRRSKRPMSPNSKDLMGSNESLNDNDSLESDNADRGFSATSKQSADSGLGDDYAHVITEFSEENKIREVENQFKPRDDLGK